jgi:hypothetical protein
MMLFCHPSNEPHNKRNAWFNPESVISLLECNTPGTVEMTLNNGLTYCIEGDLQELTKKLESSRECQHPFGSVDWNLKSKSSWERVYRCNKCGKEL